jgi:ADP-L-glycero-D-manno-heptose 6-epimerase
MIGSNLVQGLNALGIDDVIAVDDLTDGPKYRNLLGARLSDYFDRSEFYGGSRAPSSAALTRCSTRAPAPTRWSTTAGFMLDSNYRCSKDLLDACQAQGTRLLYASSAATYAAVRSFREEPEFEQPLKSTDGRSCCSTTSCGARCATITRRWPASATSTCMAARAAQGGWRRWRSITHQQLAQTGKVKLFGEYGGYGRASRCATSSTSAMFVAVNLWFLEHPDVSGIFNLGTGGRRPSTTLRSQPSTARGLSRAALRSASTSWFRTATSNTSRFPTRWSASTSASRRPICPCARRCDTLRRRRNRCVPSRLVSRSP